MQSEGSPLVLEGRGPFLDELVESHGMSWQSAIGLVPQAVTMICT